MIFHYIFNLHNFLTPNFEFSDSTCVNFYNINSYTVSREKVDSIHSSARNRCQKSCGNTRNTGAADRHRFAVGGFSSHLEQISSRAPGNAPRVASYFSSHNFSWSFSPLLLSALYRSSLSSFCLSSRRISRSRNGHERTRRLYSTQLPSLSHRCNVLRPPRRAPRLYGAKIRSTLASSESNCLYAGWWQPAARHDRPSGSVVGTVTPPEPFQERRRDFRQNRVAVTVSCQ